MIIKECEHLAKVDAMRQAMRMREEEAPYRGDRKASNNKGEAPE